MSVRADGATRADLAEATALVVGGVALLLLPVLTLADRMAQGWFWLAAGCALVGLFVGALGIRWFLTEGPELTSLPAADDPDLQLEIAVELPINVRLVDARNRLRAHILRATALGGAALLMGLDLGVLGWVVIALFLASFAADHLLLRPHRYILDAQGLAADSLLGRERVVWSEVQALHWRHYPGDEKPPFPGGERLIVERESGDDREFVFNARYGGTDASLVVRAVLPLLHERVRSLRPGRSKRPEVESRTVSAMMDSGEIRPPESSAP